MTVFAIHINKNRAYSVNTDLTFLNIVSFRYVLQCEGVVSIDPAERRRRAVLWTRNCDVH